MALNPKLAVQELISYTIVTDKAALVSLLKQYGVKLKPNPSDAEVTTATLVAIKKSKAFKKDLAKLLEKKLPNAGESFKNIAGSNEDFGFTGVDDVIYAPSMSFTGTDDFGSFTGWDDYQAANGKTTSKGISQDTLNKAKASAAQASQIAQSQQPVGKETGRFWKFIKENVLTKDNVNTGIQLGIDKINQDSLRRQNALEQQALLLQAQQDQMRSKVKGGFSGNTVLYVGVGIIALVGIGYLIMKQAKK